MFYLLHFWIWFNVKLYISYEAVTRELCLRHLFCPIALTLLAKAASPMQGGLPLDGGGWCPLGATCLQVHPVLFAACQNIATALVYALFNTMLTLLSQKSSKLSEV